MAENNLLQGHPGINTTSEWDETRRNRSENENKSNTGSYESERSNTNWGSQGQQRQQDFNRDGNKGYSNTGSNYGSNYAGRESYGTNYGQQPWGNEQSQGRGYSQASYGSQGNYGQSGQQWQQDQNNPYSQQHNYGPSQQYGQNQNQQNWNQDYGRGNYGNYSNMGSGYGSNYGEGRSSQQWSNPNEYGRTQQTWGQQQQQNQGGYGSYGNAGSSYGGNYGQTSGAGWGQGYGSEYSRGNISSTPFSQGSNDERGWGGNTGSSGNWQGAGEGNRYGQHKGRGPRGYQRSDERIKEDINDRLSDDGHIDATDIEVSLQNGEVVLKGTVDSREAKRRAEDIAESISGVHNVENRLRVKESTDAFKSVWGRDDDQNSTRAANTAANSERSNSKSSRNS